VGRVEEWRGGELWKEWKEGNLTAALCMAAAARSPARSAVPSAGGRWGGWRRVA